MDYTVEDMEGTSLSKLVTLEFSKDEFEKIYNKKLNEYTKDKSLKIPGFRPGKLPLSIVKQYRGQQARTETINILLNQGTQEFAKESTLQIASLYDSKANISDTNSTKYLTISCVIEYFPEIEMKSLSEIEIERPEVDLEETVDSLILALRKQRATFELTENPCQLDDIIHIDIHVTDSEGNVQEGLCSTDTPFRLGTQSLPQEFTTHLLGASAGDEVEFSLPAEENKSLNVKVKVLRVLEMHLPELDEEFINLFSQNKDGDIDTLREEIRKNVTRELEQLTNSYVEPQIIEKLLDLYSDVKLPEKLLESKKEELLKLTTENYNKQREKINAKDKATLESLEASFENYKNNQLDKAAYRNILYSLVIPKLFEELKVEVTPEEVENYISEIASMYEEPEAYKLELKKNQKKIEEIENIIRRNNFNKAVLAKAKVNNKKMSYTDLFRFVQPNFNF